MSNINDSKRESYAESGSTIAEQVAILEGGGWGGSGAITPTTVNGLTISTTTGTFTLTAAKVLSVTNTLTLSGNDGSTLNIGAGGTLGTGAYVSIADYVTLTWVETLTNKTLTTPILNGFIGINTASPTGILDIHAYAYNPGTVSVTGTAVTGTGTAFTRTFKVGDSITTTTSSGSETREINSITSDTVMATVSVFTGTSTNTAYTSSNTGSQLTINANGTIRAYGSTGNSNPAINDWILKNSTITQTGSQQNTAFRDQTTISQTSGTAGNVNTFVCLTQLNATGGGAFGAVRGFNSAPTVLSTNTGNITTLVAFLWAIQIQSGATGTVNNHISLLLNPTNSSTTNVVTNQYGIQISPTQAGWVLTSYSGIAINAKPAAATNSTLLLLGTTTIPTWTFGSYWKAASWVGTSMIMDNSYASGWVAQNITISNTQTNALKAIIIDTGSAAVSSMKAIEIFGRQISAGGALDGIVTLNCFSSATDPVGTTGSFVLGMHIGRNFNTTANYWFAGIYGENENNSNGSAYNTTLVVDNNSTKWRVGSNFTTGAGISLKQAWAGGTVFDVYGSSNVNSSTNGLVNYTLSNTQSAASVVQKINLWSSAQAHSAYLATWSNASTTAVAFNADMATGWTGKLFRGAVNSVEKFVVDKDGLVTTAGSITVNSATAIPAGGTAGAWVMVSSTANFGVFYGSGAPSLSAAKGSLYLRSDGSGIADRMYVNTDGSTTWTAVATAA